MNFDEIVDRLTSLYDVTQTRAVAVANEKLERMVSESKSLRAVKTIATTVSGTASYALDPTIIQVYEAKATYSTGQVNYEGDVTLSELWSVDAGTGTLDPCGHYYAIEADGDSSATTDNIRFWPAPGESSVAITGLVAIQPATLSYGSSSALPIPLDTHEHYLAGCKAALSDEEGRQDEAAKFEQVFVAGISKLAGRVTSRGKGSGRHRLAKVGYDLRR